MVFDELPTNTQNEPVLYVVSVLGVMASLNRHAAQGEHRSNTRARGAHNSLETEHTNERDIVDGDGLMRHELQKISLCARSL